MNTEQVNIKYEARAGYCTDIDATNNENNSITVKDNGRAIPTGLLL